jgi:hypothetical protein
VRKTNTAVAQLSKPQDPDRHPQNASAYSRLTQKDRYYKKQYNRDRNGEDENHHKSFFRYKNVPPKP